VTNMKKEPQTKEELCRALADKYPHFSYDELMKRNESQVYMLYTACKDEEGNLR